MNDHDGTNARAERIAALRAQIRRSLNAARAAHGLPPLGEDTPVDVTPPRYDEVFARGVEWLETL